MKKSPIGLIVAVCVLLSGYRLLQDKPVYVLEKKISVPGNGTFDKLVIDKVTNRLFIAHGTAVNVIDLSNDKYIGSINGMQDVHSIAIASKYRKGFISDGISNSVILFDLLSLRKVLSIPVSGSNPDAILYDNFSSKVFAFNKESRSASVIDALRNKEVGTIDLGGSPEHAVTDGKGNLYNNLEDINSIAVIDTKTQQVKKMLSVIPSGIPIGLALDPRTRRLFSGCRFSRSLCVIDQLTGKNITRLPIGVKVDAVAYDPDTKLIFCSCEDSTTTIIRQQSANEYKVVQTLGTQVRSNTMALDPVTHKIYISAARFEEGASRPVPGSFEILVYKMQ